MTELKVYIGWTEQFHRAYFQTVLIHQEKKVRLAHHDQNMEELIFSLLDAVESPPFVGKISEIGELNFCGKIDDDTSLMKVARIVNLYNLSHAYVGGMVVIKTPGITGIDQFLDHCGI